jgi:hypothetical protein
MYVIPGTWGPTAGCLCRERLFFTFHKIHEEKFPKIEKINLKVQKFTEKLSPNWKK